MGLPLQLKINYNKLGMEVDDENKLYHKELSISTKFSRLNWIGKDSIRVFFRKYGAYVLEIQACGQQFPSDCHYTTESILTGGWKFYVDRNKIELFNGCHFVEGTSNYKKCSTNGYAHIWGQQKCQLDLFSPNQASKLIFPTNFVSIFPQEDATHDSCFHMYPKINCYSGTGSRKSRRKTVTVG